MWRNRSPGRNWHVTQLAAVARAARGRPGPAQPERQRSAAATRARQGHDLGRLVARGRRRRRGPHRDVVDLVDGWRPLRTEGGARGGCGRRRRRASRGPRRVELTATRAPAWSAPGARSIAAVASHRHRRSGARAPRSRTGPDRRATSEHGPAEQRTSTRRAPRDSLIRGRRGDEGRCRQRCGLARSRRSTPLAVVVGTRRQPTTTSCRTASSDCARGRGDTGPRGPDVLGGRSPAHQDGSGPRDEHDESPCAGAPTDRGVRARPRRGRRRPTMSGSTGSLDPPASR